jgi:hypothetical protein
VGRGTTPLLLIYFVTLPRGYIQMTIFFGSPKIGTLIVPKLWTLISSSNQTFLEHAKKIFYSPQKDLSKGVLHSPIEDHLTPTLRGFMVESWIFNITLDPSLDHNLCILGLNEQYEGTLSIYILRPFQWYLKGPIWCFFSFSTKALKICVSCTNAIPKMGMHLGIIGFHLLHYPSFVKVCLTREHTFLTSWALALYT